MSNELKQAAAWAFKEACRRVFQHRHIVASHKINPRAAVWATAEAMLSEADRRMPGIKAEALSIISRRLRARSAVKIVHNYLCNPCEVIADIEISAGGFEGVRWVKEYKRATAA